MPTTNDIILHRWDGANWLESVGVITIDGSNTVSISGGTIVSTTTTLGLYGVTPVDRATTSITAASFVSNTSGTLDDSATWDGYTIGQVVAALRAIGILT